MMALWYIQKLPFLRLLHGIRWLLDLLLLSVHCIQEAGRKGNLGKKTFVNYLASFKRALPEVTSLHVIGQNLFRWPHVATPEVQKYCP